MHAWSTVAHTDNHVVHAYVIITTLCNHIEKRGSKNQPIGIFEGGGKRVLKLVQTATF